MRPLRDAGFRAHKAKDYDRAADLFARAAFIDADHKLAPYDLACAYAKKSDALRAEVALSLAIERGGPTVKIRAKADADFKELKAAAWFEKLVAP